MSAFNFLPNSHQTAIKKRLLALVKDSGENNESSNDEKWSETIINGILKRLRKTPNSLENFEKAITQQDCHTECVTLPRSLDGRVQFSKRKVFPHVLCAKLWRWPSIQSPNELKPIPSCKYAFNQKKEDICFNPYHYAKVDTPAIAPIIIPKYQSFAHSSTAEPTELPPLEDYSSIVPNNANVPQSPTDSLLSASSGSSYSSPLPPDYLSETDTNEPDTNGTYQANSPNIMEEDDVSEQEMQQVEYTEPRNWCSLFYYELNTRVGEVFHATQQDITVDGFTDPSNSGRFCLGVLANINRTQAVEMTRRHIGKGVRLYYIGGQVFVENISEKAVFVQSPNANHRFGWHPATVVKIPAGCQLNIFNNQLFATMLRHSVTNGFEAVYQLTRMCTIRLSFVKGWGEDYRRQTVMSCPCWIEIHLNGPLQWLDKVLHQMGPPRIQCGSAS